MSIKSERKAKRLAEVRAEKCPTTTDKRRVEKLVQFFTEGSLEQLTACHDFTAQEKELLRVAIGLRDATKSGK